MKANERQVAGTHYQDNTVKCPHCGKELQHWDIYAGFSYLIAQVTKYLWRFRDKNGIQDIEKSGHYLEKLLEVERTKETEAKVTKSTVNTAMPTIIPKPKRGRPKKETT